MSKKILFLIADGMGDYPIAELGGLTPLAKAHTPNMDEMAAKGLVGLVRTIPPSMPPGSDVANMSLMGFDPLTHHTGRGPIEAAGLGLDTHPDDLVWRLNLVKVSAFKPGGTMLDYSGGHVPVEKARDLVADLQAHLGGDEFTFHPGVGFRNLLVQHAGKDSPEAGLNIRAPHDITDTDISPDLAEFRKSPKLWDLVLAAQKRLAGRHNDTEANAVWPWGQGGPLTLANFKEKYGLTGAVISAVDLVRGLGRAAGMQVLDVPGATAWVDTDYQGKVNAAIEFLKHGDFVFLHVEAPDECGHVGDTNLKVKAIQDFDAQVVGPLRRAMQNQDAGFMIACDHFTPISVRTHTKDPALFLLSAPGLQNSGVQAFTEDTAQKSGILIEPGHEFMPWVLSKLAV